jgi:hypothetical protein
MSVIMCFGLAVRGAEGAAFHDQQSAEQHLQGHPGGEAGNYNPLE